MSTIDPLRQLPRHLCPYCEDHAADGDNYCRMCGYHLTAGKPPNVPVPTPYQQWEKYCGHCGQLRNACPGHET
jgi:hypothetical protein